MSVAAFLRSYDAEVRAKPTARPGLAVEDDGRVVRLVGDFNYVCSWCFDAAEARDVVGGQARHFQALGRPLIWRVHEHDAPAGLGAHLAEHGFGPSPPGTLMFLDLDEAAESPIPSNIEVRRVSTPGELADFLAVSDLAFEASDADALYAAYLQRMGDPTFALFAAYIDEQPVAAARVEWSGRFGQLYGGGVHPSYRGRGVYRALCHARAEASRRQGVRYLSTEARDTSRPILERLGFVPAAQEVTWVLP